MSRPDPAAILNGTRTGHICDQCNRGVRTGDLVRAYATYYENDGWILRRLWCEECGDKTIEQGTDGADEAIIEAVFWNHRLAGVDAVARNRP
jgi:hypothetical protein